jgi:hypothetical protein
MKKFVDLINRFLSKEIDYDQFYSSFNDFYFNDKFEEENRGLSPQDSEFLDEINEKIFYAASDPGGEDKKYGYIDQNEFREWLMKKKDENIHPNYQNIVGSVLKFFPEYHPSEYVKDSLDLAYVVVPDFMNFMVQEIKDKKHAELISRFFNFINDQYSNNSDKEVLNLIQLEILTPLVQEGEVQLMAEELLTGEALEEFKKVAEFEKNRK